MDDWNADLVIGRRWEDEVARRYEGLGMGVSRPISKVPYDLVVTALNCRGVQEFFTVEVKSCGGPFAFFETRSARTGTPPEYIRHSSRIDSFVRLDTTTSIGYEIDNETVVGLITSGMYRETLNRMGTAWGVVLDVRDPAIGTRRQL